MKRLLLTTSLLALLASAVEARELTVAAANMSSYLDPGRDHSNVGSQFYFNSFDPLIHKDYGKAEQVFVPGLATEWKSVSPTTMELTLRQGVIFHNGATMTADDVIFSLNRMFQADFPPYQVRMRDRLSNFERAEKVDAKRIRVHVKRPEPLWETLLNLQQLYVVPEAYVKSLAGDPAALEHADFEAFSRAPVGTGPYRVAEFVPGQRLVWERHPEFWGEPAPLDRVTVVHVPELSSRLTALRTGEAQLATNIPPDQLAIIEADPKLEIVSTLIPLFHVIIFNVNHPKMKDPRLRKALSLAIDRDLLNQTLWLGKAQVPSTHTLAEFGPLYMPELQTFRHDAAEAKRLLREAGYDGFEITYDVHSPSYYTNDHLVAQAIMEMWAAVGVKGRIQATAKWTGGDRNMMVRTWSNPMYFADPFGCFGVMWAPGGPAESEGRFNTDATYAAIWERFRFGTSIGERRAAYAELMGRIGADPPLLPLYRPYESWAMLRTVNWAPRPGHIPYVLDFRAGAIGFATN